MTESMTAFAREQLEIDGQIFVWEIKSINHRYLDVSFRLPECWRFLENELRQRFRGKIARGKLECQLRQQENLVSENALEINDPLLNRLVHLANKLSAERQLPNDLSFSKLLSWPGVVMQSMPIVEEFSDDVLTLFENTLKKLQLARRSEGQLLETEISKRLQKLTEEIVKANNLSRQQSQSARDKLLAKLASVKIDIDETRIEQEIAFSLTRLDVSEELDRLKMHCQEVAKILRVNEPTGRRLDFLMQELNREANTLSSKSEIIELTQTAVEMKVLIEQMREQIQNIE